MNSAKLYSWLLIAFMSMSPLVYANDATVDQKGAGTKLDNADCLKCHNGSKDIKVPGAEDEMRSLHAIKKLGYSKSVHAEMACVACHTGIKDGSKPHTGEVAKTTGCVQCHTELWAA
ncbi:MAG: cytochrome C, partial [Gallionella sp.]